jgi:hypothetical protein
MIRIAECQSPYIGAKEIVSIDLLERISDYLNFPACKELCLFSWRASERSSCDGVVLGLDNRVFSASGNAEQL